MNVSGVLLVAGFVTFAVGALVPPSQAYTGTPTEQLEIIGRHPIRWIGGTLGIGLGVVLTLAGLTLLHVELIQEEAGSLPVLALVSFSVGAVLFLVELAFRATVTVTVATSAGAVTDWFEPLRDWAGALYWAYMPLAYLGVAATGAVIVQTAVLGPAFGWTAVVFGTLGAAVFVARSPRWLWRLVDIPGLLYLVTGAIGVGLVVR